MIGLWLLHHLLSLLFQSLRLYSLLLTCRIFLQQTLFNKCFLIFIPLTLSRSFLLLHNNNLRCLLNKNIANVQLLKMAQWIMKSQCYVGAGLFSTWPSIGCVFVSRRRHSLYLWHKRPSVVRNDDAITCRNWMEIYSFTINIEAMCIPPVHCSIHIPWDNKKIVFYSYNLSKYIT